MNEGDDSVVNKVSKRGNGLLVQVAIGETSIMTDKGTSFGIVSKEGSKWINVIRVVEEETDIGSYAVT